MAGQPIKRQSLTRRTQKCPTGARIIGQPRDSPSYGQGSNSADTHQCYIRPGVLSWCRNASGTSLSNDSVCLQPMLHERHPSECGLTRGLLLQDSPIEWPHKTLALQGGTSIPQPAYVCHMVDPCQKVTKLGIKSCKSRLGSLPPPAV